MKRLVVLAGSLPYAYSTSCFSSNTGSVVQSDGRITLFGDRSNSTCLVDNTVDNSLKYKSCPNGPENLWEVTDSGKIKKKDSNRCILVPDKTRKYQAVKVRSCDLADSIDRQQFDIVNGRVHVRANPALCLAVVKRQNNEYGELEFLGTTISDFAENSGFEGDIMAVPCYGNNWSNCNGNGFIHSDDQTIRPFFDSENCLFARGPANQNSPVYLGSCQADAPSSRKSGKYKWTFENGMIKNVKSGLCMSMFGGIFHDNRVNLQQCDPSRSDQQFTFENGELRNSNQTMEKCMGFRTYDLNSRGKSQFVSHPCFSSSFPQIDFALDGAYAGLDLTYLVDMSAQTVSSQADLELVEDFIFKTNNAIGDSGIEDFYLSYEYFSSETEQNCISGNIGVSGVASPAELENQMVSTVIPYFGNFIENETPFCSSSDVTSYFQKYTDEMIQRANAGSTRTKVIILVVGHENGIEVESQLSSTVLAATERFGINVIGVKVGSNWSWEDASHAVLP